MRKCRLKIITASIIDDTVSPQIHYISQALRPKKLFQKKIEEENKVNDNQLPKNNKIVLKESTNTNPINQTKPNESAANNITKSVEIKDLGEITNEVKCEEKKGSNTIKLKSKKNFVNSSLRTVFQTRETKGTKNVINNFTNPMSKSVNIKFKKINKCKLRNKSISKEKEIPKEEEIDYNIGQTIDYKSLINDLIIKQCQLFKEKENFINIFEQRLNDLKEQNNKILNESSEELNRKDELTGELIVLKNQYKNLYYILNNNNKNDKRKIEIENKMKILNGQLNKGEFMIITKPGNYQVLSNDEEKNITFLLRGLFFSKHILDINKIVDLVWKFNSKIQTIYFFVKEFIKYFGLDTKTDMNILINYIYSFCNSYNYLHINEFKNEFSKKIGNIKTFNKYIYMKKILNYNNSDLNLLINGINKIDQFSLGYINFSKFMNLIKDNPIFSKKNDEIFEFLIFCMKKNRNFEDFEKENNFKTNNINIKKNKNSLFDLFYRSLQDFIDEYNYQNVYNIYNIINTYMKENEIVNVEKLLKPILNEKYLTIKDGKKYVDIIVLNKFLRKKGIIKNNEKIDINVFEEELVDIKIFINNIYENKENKPISEEELKKKANDLVDEILNFNK